MSKCGMDLIPVSKTAAGHHHTHKHGIKGTTGSDQIHKHNHHESAGNHGHHAAVSASTAVVAINAAMLEIKA